MIAVILALAAGAVVGLALGALGGGGSVLAVPALIYLLHMAPSQATTASLVIVAVTSVTGLIAHAREGRVRWRAGAAFAAAGLPLAIAFGALSHRLPQALLTTAFAILAAIAATRMLLATRVHTHTDHATTTATAAATPSTHTGTGTNASTTATDNDTGGTTRTATATATQTATQTETAPATSGAVRPTRAALAGAGLGGVTGLLGVGGGFLAVPALVTVLRFSMPQAVGTSLLVIAANALASLGARIPAATTLNWALVGPFLAAAILGAWDGKRIAAKLSGDRLQRAFAILLLLVAAYMLISTLIH